jgi:HEAT repeat protein
VFKLALLPRNMEAALRDVASDKFEVRLSAVKDLGRLADGAARVAVLDRLEELLEADGAAGVRSEAALALAEARAVERLDALLAALSDDHERVRQMALLALGEVARADDARVVEALRDALGSGAAALRYQALVALHHLEALCEDALVAALDDADAQVRYVALRVAEERWVGAERGREAAPAAFPAAIIARIRGAAEDTVPKVRLGAAILLGRARVEGPRAPLVDAVNDGTGVREPEDEQAAIELCGALGLDAARRGLVRRAFGWRIGRDAFYWQARVALAKMGDARAIESILRGLGALGRDARTLAVAAVGEAGLVEALGRVRAMRGDDRRVDQNAVQQTLTQLGAIDSERDKRSPDPSSVRGSRP